MEQGVYIYIGDDGLLWNIVPTGEYLIRAFVSH